MEEEGREGENIRFLRTQDQVERRGGGEKVAARRGEGMMSELDARGEGKGRLGFDREGKEEEKEENTMNG